MRRQSFIHLQDLRTGSGWAILRSMDATRVVFLGVALTAGARTNTPLVSPRLERGRWCRVTRCGAVPTRLAPHAKSGRRAVMPARVRSRADRAEWRDAGIAGLRVQSTFASRSAAHVTLSAALGLRNRQPRWLAVGAAAVASDMLMRSWLRRDGRWRAAARISWDSIDAAFWAWHTRHDPSDGLVRQIMLGDVAPHAIETGLRLSAGTDAQPVLDGSRQFPPRDVAGVVAMATKASAALLPSAAVRLVRRHWGNPEWQVGENLWPLAALLLPVPLARTRHVLQQRAIRDWEGRAQRAAELQGGDLRLALAATQSIGHDFPKVFQILGFFGSDEAREAGLQSLDGPRRIASETGTGLLLGQVVPRGDLDPPEAALRWLAYDDIASVRAFLQRPGARSAHGPVEVRLSSKGTIVLRLGEEAVVLRQAIDRVKGNLDPIEGVLAVSVFWKLAGLQPGWGAAPGNRWPVVLGASLDAIAAVDHRTRSGDGSEPNRRSLAISLLSLALVSCREALDQIPRHTANGAFVAPTTMSTCGTLGLLGTWWEDLGPERWIWLAASLSLFGLGVTRGGRRREIGVLWELVPLWQVFGSVVGLTRVLTSERDVLAAHLGQRYQAQLVADGAAILEAQLATYKELLRVARGAVSTLVDALPTEVANEVMRRCDELDGWLEAPDTAEQLALLSARVLGVEGLDSPGGWAYRPTWARF